MSDVARLVVLFENGGVYLDTDVELKKPIQDEWLQYESFLFFEFESRIATGLGFGCKKGSECIKYLADDYLGRKFIKNNGSLNLQACTYYNTNALERYFASLELNDKFQVIDGNAFMSTGMYNQIACHHYASSWTDSPKNKIEKKREWKDSRIKRFLRKPERQKWIRMHMGVKVSGVYTFIAYDLTEMGLGFYLKRWFKKYIIKMRK